MSFANVITCPFCKGEVNADAIRCRSCGSLMSDGLTRTGAARRFKVVVFFIALVAASLTFFTVSRAGKADIHVQSVAGDQTTTR